MAPFFYAYKNRRIRLATGNPTITVKIKRLNIFSSKVFFLVTGLVSIVEHHSIADC